ncbi:MAG: hypothetical protein HQ582_16260, partial [Planctomycetes bacterium]|nr:hypothetical protein [Planctomycetota bacterium]
MSDRKRTVPILLVDNEATSSATRARTIELFEHDRYQYQVWVALGKQEARELIEQQRFEFMLVDLLLRPDSSASVVAAITDEHVDDEENGACVAQSLLH